MTVQENLGIVLIKRTLVVTDSGHVLDDNAMVGMLAFLVKDVVGSNHIVDHVGFGDLLGAELLLRAQIHTVVVAEMVVAGNGGELDTGVDQEVNES